MDDVADPSKGADEVPHLAATGGVQGGGEDGVGGPGGADEAGGGDGVPEGSEGGAEGLAEEGGDAVGGTIPSPQTLNPHP